MKDTELINKIKELLNEDKKCNEEIPSVMLLEEQTNYEWLMGLLILWVLWGDECKVKPTINIYFGVDE